jgi:hypothetical protein
MIRHLVLVKFRKDLPPGEKEGVLAQLSALQQVIPGMAAFEHGPNVSPEGLDRGFGHGFICYFIDEQARDLYLVHPAHAQAGARLVAATEGGVEGLLVFDMGAGAKQSSHS